MPKLLNDTASQAGHWYTQEGKPAYTIIGANGQERPTTLRDARKLGLFPSVTSIIRLAAAPALERWKAEQLLMSALTLPRQDGEQEKDWIARVWKDSKEQARKAAEKGTAIHGAIERVIRHEEVEHEHALIAREALRVAGYYEEDPLSWGSERSFAHPFGFGGKVDLHSADRGGAVIDFKGKDGDLSQAKLYDDHFMQLAAYAHGLGIPDAQCSIVFFGRELPARALRVVADRSDLARGWGQFQAILDFKQAKEAPDVSDVSGAA